MALNRAIAVSKMNSPDAGLKEFEQLPEDRFKSFRPWHVARAELLAELGAREEAVNALDAALKLAPARAERLYLEGRRIELNT